ncbi:MAG TPA: hypothetical protein VK590_05620 [Saprospiraceae bacterium]|nr:hypothetical protein [Saprospiraceae bacterium]
MASFTIWDVWNQVFTKLNKDQSGASFSIPQFNLIAKFVCYEYFKVKVGLPEAYKPGFPIAPQNWQCSQNISDTMRRFLIWMGGPDDALMKLDVYGIATIPRNYIAFSSCYFDQQVDGCADELTPRPIDFVTDAVWADRVQSPLKKPTFEVPIAKWFGDKAQFLPARMGFVNFSYLREPIIPELVVTYDSNNDPVYDTTNSVQIDFPDVCIPDITNLIFEVASLNIKDQLDLQAAIQRKMAGQ